MAKLPPPPQGTVDPQSPIMLRYNNALTLAINASTTSFAPVTAAYVVNTANADLTGAQVLSVLASGFVKVTNGTGVLTSSGSNLIQTTDIQNNAVTTSKLSLTGVSASTYGDGSNVAQFTVGVDGRVIAATTVPIAGTSPGGIAGGSLGGTYPNPTVVTNANLTGPITSVGNTTSIASQTGTGSKFVVDTAPTILLPVIADSSDATKNIAFTLSGATTAKTMTIVSSQTNSRTLTLPDATDTLVGKATTDTLTNKTLTSPTMTSPVLGTVASGVISACTSTSMVLTTPVLGTPTSGTLTNCTGYTDANLSTSDVTTNNVSTSKHGFAPKAPNDATKFLDGTGAYSVPTGTSVATGTMFNIQQAQLTTTVAQANTSMTNVSGLAVAITPTSGSNKVLVRAVVQLCNDSSNLCTLQLARGSTAIGVGTTVGSRLAAGAAWITTVTNDMHTIVMEWLDSPGTTSATTYNFMAASTAGNVYINRTATDTNSGSFPRTASTITAIEVKV